MKIEGFNELKKLADRSVGIAREITWMVDQLRATGVPQHKSSEQLPIDLWVSALEASPVLIIEMKPEAPDDPEIVWVGKILETLLGYFPGELQGKPLSIVVPEDKREAHRGYTRK